MLEIEKEREDRTPRREYRQRKETEQLLQSSFITSFLGHVTKTQMWDIRTDQSADYSFTPVLKVWQLADPQCIHILADRSWSQSAPLCLQELQMAFLLLKICLRQETNPFVYFQPYNTKEQTVFCFF